MISRQQGRGDAGPPRRIEEADDAANKDSALIQNWNNINYNNDMQERNGLANHNKYTFINLDNYCAIH